MHWTILIIIMASITAAISYMECHDCWNPITHTFWDDGAMRLVEGIAWTLVAILEVVYLFTHLWG